MILRNMARCKKCGETIVSVQAALAGFEGWWTINEEGHYYLKKSYARQVWGAALAAALKPLKEEPAAVGTPATESPETGTAGFSLEGFEEWWASYSEALHRNPSGAEELIDHARSAFRGGWDSAVRGVGRSLDE